jgi:hypothetical protein
MKALEIYIKETNDIKPTDKKEVKEWNKRYIKWMEGLIEKSKEVHLHGVHYNRFISKKKIFDERTQWERELTSSTFEHIEKMVKSRIKYEIDNEISTERNKAYRCFLKFRIL